MVKIGVLGAGTWGITLARMLCNSGKDVTVWSKIEAEIDNLQETGRHPNLPDMTLPKALRYTKSLKDVCQDKEVLLCAVPSVFVRSTIRKAKPYIPDGQIIVDVAKGMEADTMMTMTEVIEDECKNNTVKLVALSGPTHAEEVAIDLPTTIVSACKDIAVANYVQEVFSTPAMRVYTNTDVKGVELCGALKNIIALAAGISCGLGYGDNTKAAIITRGIAEMTRLGEKMGCTYNTFHGLAGIGDLVVTCTSMHSRNNQAGILIGKGYSAKEAVEKVGMVVEGINALPAAMKFSEVYGVELPIVSVVDAVVNHGLEPKKAVYMLMERERKMEF